MASIPESDWVGCVDYNDREILYVKKLKTPSFYGTRLAIVLTKRSQLEIMLLSDVVEVVTQGKPSLIFQGRVQNINLKAGGKKYFGNDETRTQTSYKMDYDPNGNLWVRTIQWKNQIDGPYLFMSKLWVTIIKRRQRLQKVEYKKQKERR